MDEKLELLIKQRNVLRKQEKDMTNQIKEIRREISESRQKPKGNIQRHPLIIEAREKLMALRISCRKALKEAGYDKKRIAEIFNISYTRLMQQEFYLKRDTERRCFIK